MTRVWLGKTAEALPLSDLSAVQKESVDQLLKEGILEVLEEINPIQDYTGRGWELSFNKPRYGKPRIIKEEAIKKGLTFSFPWYLTAELKEVKSGKTVSQEIYMGEIPQMTEGGTFIGAGIERRVDNQLRRPVCITFY